MDENRPEHHYFLISPIHQKFVEFEGRIRKWRIFNRGHATHRSASSDQKKDVRVKKVRPACLTSPIPRKTLHMDVSTSNMPPPLPPRRMTGNLRDLDLVNTRRPSPNEEELNARFERIQQNSGVLVIGGTTFQGVRLENLELVSDLGSGACGTVTKRKLQSRPMAVKEMKRTNNQEETKRIFMDLEVIRKSNDCPYIVKCYGFIITMDHLYICMELMATCLEKLLFKLQSGFPEEIIGKMTLSVVLALDYLKEKHSIMHRDVKPSNILLDWHGNVKLCDFGISGQLIDSKASTMSTGCTAYLAPERVRRQPYDIRSDVWSLGITLIHLATGKSPYDPSMNPFQLMAHIDSQEPPRLDDGGGFSPEFRDFVGLCLQKELNYRPKYKELLQHPFLQRVHEQNVDVGLWFTNPEEYASKRYAS
ncbi:CBN-MEK-1 protein [Aphelenchoides avenae]|nr:CBN-MEK-1 protein [Aphelenchus avenae]